jgi:hypothetical protein
VHLEFLIGRGGGCADLEAVYKLCLISNTMLSKSCHKYNVT